MKDLWRRHPKLVAAFALALSLTLFFLGNIVWQAVYWSNHRDEAVQAWMTVGYVGRSWGLDPFLIDEVAGLPKPQGHPLSLKEIAAQRGVPVSEVIAQVEAAIAQLQKEDPQK